MTPWEFIERVRDRLRRDSLCLNVNRSAHPRNCLVLYVSTPFRRRHLRNSHQNLLQVRELARVIGEFGYNVDVMDFNDRRVRLTRAYDLVIDLHPGLNPIYRDHMAPGCKRIAYITGSNPAFANAAEDRRLEDLYRRRGVRLKPRRHTQPFNKAELEAFDAMFFIGNAYNLRTFEEFALKQVHFIRNTGYVHFKSLDLSHKEPRAFLYIGSTGQVHKGLDLLLEVFERRTDLELYVAGNLKAEEDFYAAYREQLLNRPNIQALGFVDIDDPAFQAVAARCGHMVLPSCSEGVAGAVLTAMSLGLVPIVSRECGFEDDEVQHLEACSLEAIERALDDYAGRPRTWLATESARMLELVTRRYSMAEYASSVRHALKGVLTK